MAVEQLKGDVIGRTVRRKLNCGVKISPTKSLLAHPNPMSGDKLGRLAAIKWLAMISLGSAVVGQSDGKYGGLIRGQRCILPGTRAANQKQPTNKNG